MDWALCGTVKRERLDWLAENPRSPRRFAMLVGRRWRTATIKDVAWALRLDWETVKELEKEYRAEPLRRIGPPAPEGIGIDEISLRKGHPYRIVVSALIRGRPIWFGGGDRSEASLAQFYRWLGPKQGRRVRLPLRDMGKPFANATRAALPGAAILFDKFQVMRPLGEALAQVRKSEYARLSGPERRFIKGPKYALLSPRENLTWDGRRALREVRRINRRLNVAYGLKEAFGQLWDYQREAWAWKCFQNWRSALRWQRLRPDQKFARTIEKPWPGIAAYCQPENKVSLGYVEGLNNKIRGIQRRAYGSRDEASLRLKVLTGTRPQI